MSFSLVILGLWSYESSGRDFHTLSIPLMGILLSLLHRPLQENEAKWILVALAITLIYALILIVPVMNTIKGNNPGGLVRVTLMWTVCILALMALLWRWSKIK